MESLNAIGLYDVLLPYILLFALTIIIIWMAKVENHDPVVKKILVLCIAFIIGNIVAFVTIFIFSFLAIIASNLQHLSYLVILGLIYHIYTLKKK